MEAEELMIGDWVLDKAVSEKPVQVLQINLKNVHYEHEKGYISVGTEIIEPVPLTHEILEKNGFEREGGASRCKFDKWWLSILHWNKGRLELIISDDSTKLYTLDIDLKYVHQLQHALRLLGINKNIEL